MSRDSHSWEGHRCTGAVCRVGWFVVVVVNCVLDVWVVVVSSGLVLPIRACEGSKELRVTRSVSVAGL